MVQPNYLFPEDVDHPNNTTPQTRNKPRLESTHRELTKWPIDRESLSTVTKAHQDIFEMFGVGDIITTPVSNIHHAFEQYAAEQPYSVAVRSGSEFMTYGELNSLAGVLASRLRAKGIKVGDCVPLFLERSIDMVVGIIAILKCGAAYVPQHVGVATDAQLAHITSLLTPPVILTLRKFQRQIDNSCIGEYGADETICIDEFIESVRTNNSATQDLDKYRANDIPTDSRAIVLFTSGTTGMPNGVQVSHRNLCNILTIAPGNLGIKPGLNVSQILSISFDMAAWEILGCIANGGTLLIRGKDIEETACLADVVIATPSILARLDMAQFASVKTVAVAGEPCPRPLADQWSGRCDFYNCCGPTETTIVNTMSLHQRDNPQLCIGKPTPNNTVYILNENKEPCLIGEAGEMWAGGDCVSLGYLNNDELNSERYADDPFLGQNRKMFNTRDLGRWCENGELEHLGRTDDQVKIRGFRVELDSVSAILENQEDCTRAVTLKYDSRNLVAFVMPSDVDTEAAKEAVANSLPYYCVPERIICLDALPMTSRGKIDKRALIESAKIIGLNPDATPAIQPAAPTVESRVNPNHNDHGPTATLPIESYDSVTLPPPEPTLRARLSHPKYYHYWRLMNTTLLLNAVMLIYAMTAGNWWSANGIAVTAVSNMVIANLFLAIVIRQQYVINLLFKLATSVPVSAPLRLRQLMGKVYHFGGLHIGGAIAGTVWTVLLIGSVIVQKGWSLPGIGISGTTIMSAIQIGLLLVLMLVMANPKTRQTFHNQFEIVHRFGGWALLALFWVHFLSFTHDISVATNTAFASALLSSVGFWLLVLITISIALPWLRLKKVEVQIERPSDHVILARFDYGVTPFAGSSTAISRSPLTEWHSFANVPEPGRDGFRLTISRAGDWTGRLIDDLPSHVWVKGIPTAGVGNIDQLFKRVVWIATGSGIGPTLPHLLAQEVPAHLVWSTRNARKTYGDDLVDEILAVEPNALIWDTDERGRPDLVQLAYAAVQAFDAEAVIVIANEKLTRMVVHGMESRHIPAYGAIWDS